MRVQTKTVTRTTYDDLNIELSHTPASIMDYKKEFFKISPNGDLAVVGYLVDDQDCDDPLKSSEGMGSIVEARRNGSRLEHGTMQRALGLDSEWQPNYDLIDNDAYKTRFVDAVIKSQTFVQAYEKSGNTGLSLVEYARLVFDDNASWEHPEGEACAQALWAEGRENGTIGNPLAVSLDVHEHGSVAYSVSTGRHKNDFDTASGGAMWIPDAIGTEDIRYRAMKTLLPEGTEVAYKSHDDVLNDIMYTLPNGTTVGEFKNFTVAIDAAAAAQDITVDPTALADAMRVEAVKDAASNAQVYTDWRNGNTFGFVIDEFALTDDGTWEAVESDDTYGFIGDDDAMESMESEAQALADHHQQQNEKTFVECEKASLSALENVRHSEYDHKRGGVTMTMTPALEAHLRTMPADFTIQTTPENDQKPQADVITSAASRDNTPTP